MTTKKLPYALHVLNWFALIFTFWAAALFMINLYTCTYRESDHERAKELSRCLELNKMAFDRVVEIDGERPAFDKIFRYVNAATGDSDLNIVANSDIYFEKPDLAMIDTALEVGQVFALTRWDAITGEFFGRSDSQDSWCFRGRIGKIAADFVIGRPGCDNKLAWLLRESGYVVTNPSLSIRSWHLHQSGERKWWGEPPVPPPYLRLEPTGI